MSLSSTTNDAHEKYPHYGVHREDLVCSVLGLEYNATQRVGLLWLAPYNCTDMQGAIKLFRAIDPEVSQIFTFQVAADLHGPGIPDTAYVRDPRDGKWVSLREELAAKRLRATGLLPLTPSKLITEMPASSPDR